MLLPYVSLHKSANAAVLPTPPPYDDGGSHCFLSIPSLQARHDNTTQLCVTTECVLYGLDAPDIFDSVAAFMPEMPVYFRTGWISMASGSHCETAGMPPTANVSTAN